jgi:putative transposase
MPETTRAADHRHARGQQDRTGAGAEPPGRTVLAALTEEQRARAMQRWRILQPHIEEKVPLPAAAAAARVPVRTLERWLARYRDGGLTGLARSPRSDRGRRKLPGELVALIEGLALRRPPPSTAAVHRQAALVAAG